MLDPLVGRTLGEAAGDDSGTSETESSGPRIRTPPSPITGGLGSLASCCSSSASGAGLGWWLFRTFDLPTGVGSGPSLATQPPAVAPTAAAAAPAVPPAVPVATVPVPSATPPPVATSGQERSPLPLPQLRRLRRSPDSRPRSQVPVTCWCRGRRFRPRRAHSANSVSWSFSKTRRS